MSTYVGYTDYGIRDYSLGGKHKNIQPKINVAIVQW